MNTSIALVDRHDEIIGETDVISAHLGMGKRHRAISVFLVNKDRKLLIQQRSEKKFVGQLQLSNTCCGNVRTHETREECAYRRLREELGIERADITSLYRFEYHIPCNEKFSEWEIDEVFIGKYNGAVMPNPDEVAAYAWKSPAEIYGEIESQNIYTPWSKIIFHDLRLRSQLKS